MIPEIMDIIIKVISKQRDHARDVVEAIIDSEQNYLFTNDLGYKDARTDIVSPNQPGQPNDPQSQNQGPTDKEVQVARITNNHLNRDRVATSSLGNSDKE